MRKLTFSEVAQAFNDGGCQLLATEYVDCKTPMPYICNCGNKTLICWSNFRNGQRCARCAGSERHSLSFVSEYFHSKNCKLLAKSYTNIHTLMPFICSCGEKSNITFCKFKQGLRCEKCKSRNRSEGQRFGLDYVARFFESQGCKLLSTEYVNNETPLSYVCKCGNKSKIRFANFQQGGRCKECGKKATASKRRHKLADVAQCFEQQGCKLLSTEYANNRTPLSYICNCGNKANVAFHDFQKGERCKHCRYVRTADKMKHSYDDVKQCFDSDGCKLLAEDYLNCRTPMAYICSCGNESTITFTSFQLGCRCKKCAGLEKHNFEFVFQYFQSHDCILLAKEYVDNQTPMPYVCNCGNISHISFGNFKTGYRCRQCGTQRRSEKRKHSYDYVRLYFESQGCKLLSTEYTNAHILMPYICKCGNESLINFDNFSQGGRCKKCADERGWKTRAFQELLWEQTDIEQLQNSIKERLR